MLRFFCVCLNLVITVWAAISYQQLFGSKNFLDQTLIENTPQIKNKKNYLHAERHVEISSNVLQGWTRAESNRVCFQLAGTMFLFLWELFISFFHHFFFGNEHSQLTFSCWRLFFRSHRLPNRFSFFMVTIWLVVVSHSFSIERDI